MVKLKEIFEKLDEIQVSLNAIDSLQNKLIDIEEMVPVDVIHYVHEPEKFLISNPKRIAALDDQFELGYLTNNNRGCTLF